MDHHTTRGRFRRFGSQIPTLLTALGGVLVSLVIYHYVHEHDLRAIQRNFEDAADDCRAAIQRTVAQNIEILYGMRAFYDSSQFVERNEFRSFAAGFLERHPEIEFLAWWPRVPKSERDAFENDVRASGMTRFSVHAPEDTGTMTGSGEHRNDFPVLYIEPFAEHMADLGTDQNLVRASRDAMQHAMANGNPASSDLILRDPKAGPHGTGTAGFLILMPVATISNAVETFAADSRDPASPLKGFIAAFYRIDMVVQRSIGDLTALRDIEVEVWTTSDSDEAASLITRQPAAPLAGTTEPVAIAHDFEGLRTVSICGRIWHVRCLPSQQFLSRQDNPSAPWALLAGLTITLLLSGYLFASVKRAEEQSRDAVQLAQLNADLSGANLRLEKLDLLRNEFLSAAAHELNTPIAILRGVSDILHARQQEDVPSWQRDIFAVAERNVIRLSRLVKNLLNTSRIVDRQLVLSRRETDLVSLVQGVAQDMAPLAQHAKIRVETRLPDGPLLATVDDEKMIAVATNLAENAIRFARSRVLLELRSENDGFALSVEDDGPGIADEEMDFLFRRYSQLKSANGKGHMGLGLAIVHAIVTGHGGQVDASNRPEDHVGLRITLRIPNSPFS